MIRIHRNLASSGGWPMVMSDHHMDFSSPSFTLTEFRGAMERWGNGYHQPEPSTLHGHWRIRRRGKPQKLNRFSDGAWNYTLRHAQPVASGHANLGTLRTPPPVRLLLGPRQFGNSLSTTTNGPF